MVDESGQLELRTQLRYPTTSAGNWRRVNASEDTSARLWEARQTGRSGGGSRWLADRQASLDELGDRHGRRHHGDLGRERAPPPRALNDRQRRATALWDVCATSGEYIITLP